MTALESKALGIALEKLNLTDLPPSYLQIAAWKRYEQRLTDYIGRLTIERDELRERLRCVERDQ